MSGNLPDGVTDAHPHFNPNEGSVNVTCGADEALVVPSFFIKGELARIKDFAEGFAKVAMSGKNEDRFVALGMMIGQLDAMVRELEQDGGYGCPFQGVMDVDISEEAHWDCPVCGNERVSDTVPEDRDPDEGWDSRYDD